MLFARVLPLFLAATASALTLVERTASQIVADLKTVDTDIKSLTSALNNWDCSLTGATAVQSAEQKLEKDLNATISDLQNQPVFTCADVATIVNYINNTLEPDLRQLLAAIKAKQACITKDGLTAIFHDDVARLKKLFDQLLQTLLAHSCSSQQSNVKAAQAKIDQDFSDCSSCRKTRLLYT